MSTEPVRPPSVDSLARELARSHALPHMILVDCARRAINDSPGSAAQLAASYASDFSRMLHSDVVNATGVLLHSNLGRAPLPALPARRANNVEFDLNSGERGSRHDAVSRLLALLTGCESAIVVNNNAAALVLVLSALAHGRDVVVSRGESVEIGGGFRIPDVMEQSGARLVDVGTTNRTRPGDYRKAVDSKRNDVALIMKIHPSNFSVQGFTEQASVKELSALPVPVVADIGSGLLDSACPWLHDRIDATPPWLANEPAARQSLADGAALVTFSGDKLLGGPQCGIVAGRADLVDQCARHPLMRALRPGAHTLMLLQATLLSYCNRSVCDDVPFWNMLTQPLHALRERAEYVVGAVGAGAVVELASLAGAGSAPGTSIPSFGIEIRGDLRDGLRAHSVPVIARASSGMTFLDMRTVHPDDDATVIDALRAVTHR
jgi:L-seryl-tRNA(Ser) seleniumtransferase